MAEPLFVFRVGRIRKALRREFEARAALLEITPSQYQVLYRLWQGDGILTSVLAREAESDGSTMTGLLDRLEAKGLLRRERSARDRRAVRVFLTPSGRELAEPLQEWLRQIDEQALSGLTAEARAQLMATLDAVSSNLAA